MTQSVVGKEEFLPKFSSCFPYSKCLILIGISYLIRLMVLKRKKWLHGRNFIFMQVQHCLRMARSFPDQSKHLLSRINHPKAAGILFDTVTSSWSDHSLHQLQQNSPTSPEIPGEKRAKCLAGQGTWSAECRAMQES